MRKYRKIWENMRKCKKMKENISDMPYNCGYCGKVGVYMSRVMGRSHEFSRLEAAIKRLNDIAGAEVLQIPVHSNSHYAYKVYGDISYSLAGVVEEIPVLTDERLLDLTRSRVLWALQSVLDYTTGIMNKLDRYNPSPFVVLVPTPPLGLIQGL